MLRTNDYHLLVAQNFLSNISLDGTHNDTNLQFFERKMDNQGSLASLRSGSCDSGCLDEGITPLIGAKTMSGCLSRHPEKFSRRTKVRCVQCCRDSQPQETNLQENEGLIVDKRSIAEEKKYELGSLTEGKTKTTSELFDQSLVDDRSVSPISVTQFAFLRRLRTSFAKADRSRSYLCASSGAPLIVISHFSFQPNVRDRSRIRRSRSSIGSTERIQQSAVAGSVEELRPFDFKDVEYVQFEQLVSKLRRSSVMSQSGVAWKSPCKEERRTSDAVTSQLLNNSSLAGHGYTRENSELHTENIGGDSDSYQLEGEDTRRSDYDPMMLDEIASASRTIIRVNGFIGVTKLFASPQASKASLNDTFAERFPSIHLTYSKLRSIKRDLWLLAKECDVDEYTLAHTFVYFERIVCRGLISKYNRKFIAGVAFLIAVKLNDYKKPVIVKVLERAEEHFRISRREMLSFELPVCSALQFDLFPPAHHVEPHLGKIMFGVF